MEVDHDEGIEGWKIHVELLNFKWQKILTIKEKRKLTLDGIGNATVAMVGDGENGSVVEEGEGMLGIGSKDRMLHWVSTRHLLPQMSRFLAPTPLPLHLP